MDPVKKLLFKDNDSRLNKFPDNKYKICQAIKLNGKEWIRKIFLLKIEKKIDFIENESDSICNIIITYNQQSKTRTRSASMYILLCRIKNDHLMYKKTQITKGSRDCSSELVVTEH